MVNLPKTFIEQIEELKSEGVIITNESQAEKILKNVNFSQPLPTAEADATKGKVQK